MKLLTVIGCLFFTLNLISCSKQIPLPAAVLNFRYHKYDAPVEWLEITGSRYKKNGDLFITADGFDFERFHLCLENVTRTGLVKNVTHKHISYHDNYGFKTGSLQAVELRIIEVNNHKLYGSFDVVFVNSSNDTDTIRANGEFSIFGQE